MLTPWPAGAAVRGRRPAALPIRNPLPAAWVQVEGANRQPSGTGRGGSRGAASAAAQRGATRRPDHASAPWTAVWGGVRRRGRARLHAAARSRPPPTTPRAAMAMAPSRRSDGVATCRRPVQQGGGINPRAGACCNGGFLSGGRWGGGTLILRPAYAGFMPRTAGDAGGRGEASAAIPHFT